MSLIWSGRKWPEQERKPAVDPRFYEAMRRAGVTRIKPARKPDWSALIGLVGLVLMAALVTGGVFFWLGAFAGWMNTR